MTLKFAQFEGDSRPIVSWVSSSGFIGIKSGEIVCGRR